MSASENNTATPAIGLSIDGNPLLAGYKNPTPGNNFYDFISTLNPAVENNLDKVNDQYDHKPEYAGSSPAPTM